MSRPVTFFSASSANNSASPRLIHWFLILCCISIWTACVADPFVQITKSDGSIVRVRVSVADTPGERVRGLQHVTFLPEGAGMLFVFPKSSEESSFWMKDTPLSLDLIFVDGSCRITQLILDTIPNSVDKISSNGSVKYALEVPAGFVRRNGLEIGDVIKIER